MKQVNLVLAIVWFITAGILYYYDPGEGRRGIIPIPLSAAALILGLYNLVRWWTFRVAQVNREEGERLQARRPRLRRESDNLTEPDPNFVFNDPQKAKNDPASPGTNGTGHPPEPKT